MNQPNEASRPPQAVLSEMINGYWLTGCLVAVARLGVADRLRDEPRPIEELARELGADAPSLYRVLRALAAVGVFAEGPDRAFAHTPLSAALRTGVPGSMHGLAAMTGLMHLHAWPALAHTLQTGETAFDHVFGKGVFEHATSNAEAGAAFDAAMASYTAGTSNAVVGGYDFSRFGTIVDLGGGNGALLSAILRKFPEPRGVTFDLPSVSERARASLGASGLDARCEVVAGDFFDIVPAGDAYTLKMILHDWDDERSRAILRNVRRAIRPGGRILVMEAVLEAGNGVGAPAKLLDVNMLVMTGGRERSAAEYAALFDATGFRLERVVPAHPMLGIVEGIPV